MNAWGFVSNRLFDALACETTVISEDQPEVDELFEGTVLTFRNASDLRALVDAALADRPAARARAAHGRELVVRTAHVRPPRRTVRRRAAPPRVGPRRGRRALATCRRAGPASGRARSPAGAGRPPRCTRCLGWNGSGSERAPPAGTYTIVAVPDRKRELVERRQHEALGVGERAGSRRASARTRAAARAALRASTCSAGRDVMRRRDATRREAVDQPAERQPVERRLRCGPGRPRETRTRAADAARRAPPGGTPPGRAPRGWRRC